MLAANHVLEEARTPTEASRNTNGWIFALPKNVSLGQLLVIACRNETKKGQPAFSADKSRLCEWASLSHSTRVLSLDTSQDSERKARTPRDLNVDKIAWSSFTCLQVVVGS